MAGTLADVAALVLAAGWAIITIAILVVVISKRRLSVDVQLPGGVGAKLETFESTLTDLTTKVDQINTAVNHQPEGASTLVQRVQAIEAEAQAHRRWEAAAMQLIGQQLGIAIPPPPEEEPS